MRARFFVSIVLLAALTTGFRIFPGEARWTTSVADPVVWLRFCERPEFDRNNLPSGDPLHGQTLTFNSLSQSVRDDYSNVQTSFIELRDTGTDAGFDPSRDRVIDVCFSGSLFLAAGFATRKTDGKTVTGCEIKLSDKLKSSAMGFVATLTHEIGHCMGLDHTQDLSYAIMSYFREPGLVRLQTDDKMGLTYMYPSDPEYGREAMTFGLSCN
ncbi:MAG TPA: matrixin family metalloprotease [Bdellovibrionales bacterium]|nr:matrixin family metalloprotease [Bdellovibrionales bacterium]